MLKRALGCLFLAAAISLIPVVIYLLVQGCHRPGRPIIVGATPRLTITPSVIPTLTLVPTLIPTQTSVFCTPANIPTRSAEEQTACPGTAVPVPSGSPTGEAPSYPTADPQGENAVCRKGGIAEEFPNQAGGAVYSQIVLGDAGENCWITGQLWWAEAGSSQKAKRWVIAIAPGTKVELGTFRGGTFWFLTVGNRVVAEAELDKQINELGSVEGELPIKVFLPGDEGLLAPLTVKVISPKNVLNE